MAYFFIDTDDGDPRHRDEIGCDLADAEAARFAALDALPDIAREKIPDGDHRGFGVTVRINKREVIFIATLALMGGWKALSR